MSGYAASARLQGGSPKLMVAGGRIERWTAETAEDEPSGGLIERLSTESNADVPSLGNRLAARMDDLLEVWSQTTFFLFDPDSWR